MKPHPLSLAICLAAMLGAPAARAADPVAGAWRVTGQVAAFAFTLNCEFKPEGERLGGVCVDAATNDPKVKGGRSHPLTAGDISGDKVRWTYQSSFLLSRFAVSFSGVRDGDHMTGAISVQGHAGAFTAVRL